MQGLQLRVLDDGAPAFAENVVSILNSAIATTLPTSPDDTARSLDELLNQDYAKHGTAGSFLWWFWDLFHDLACQVPHDSSEQDKIAVVIKALHDLPPRSIKLGEDWGTDGNDAVQVWTGLPMFGNTLREKISSEENKERRLNLQAYAARVLGHGLVPLEMYAIWSLVDVLEGTMKPIRGAPDEVNPDPAAVEDITHKVQIAAAWIIHAGHVLYGRDEDVHGATAGPLWKLDKKEAIKQRRKLRGTDGLSPERWQLWKQRFAVIRDADAVITKARDEAAAAVNAMEGVEAGQK